MSSALRRRFVDVAGRSAHYLRAGAGPPLLLIHSSPMRAQGLTPLIGRLADRHTCFAFDTPGFGDSDPLLGEQIAIGDLADALAANMRAIGLPPCPVFGTHTGAAIALQLGARHPELVTGLVLDGVPLFTAAECASLFDGYFEEFPPDPLGGHFARAWTRFRDQYVWFPWTSRRVADQNDYGIGTPEALDDWLLSFFLTRGVGLRGYRAAIASGAAGLAAAAALRCPVVYFATETDMLRPHLDRLPTPGAGQEIWRIGRGEKARDEAVRRALSRMPPAPRAAPPDAEFVASTHGFVDLPHGQMRVRQWGDKGGAPLLLLHDAPGSSRVLEPQLREAATSGQRAVAIDLPGCGDSAALPEAAGLDAYADVAAAVLDALAMDRPRVLGQGIGASIAVELGRRAPERVGELALDGLFLPENDIARAQWLAAYAPPIIPDAAGSHWYRTWLMLRDSLIYYPWFAPVAANRRRIAADFSAGRLHDWTLDVMKQRDAYRRVIQAALAHDAATALRSLKMPVAAKPNPATPFFANHDRLADLIGRSAGP